MLLLAHISLDRVGLYSTAAQGLFVVLLDGIDYRLQLLGLAIGLDVVPGDQGAGNQRHKHRHQPEQEQLAPAHLHTRWLVMTRSTALPTVRAKTNQA